MIALDSEVFGIYGADESPEVIAARVAVFPTGCVALEEADENGDALLIGYLTTEKWSTLREPALDENPTASHAPDGRVLCITTLVVGAQHQRRGLGKRLLDHAIEIAMRERCEQIVLETAHAERFYQRHGFEKIGEREQRGIHLPIMRLRL
ncbi:MAG: GNAT family N-acetyltransferase [Caldilineaceae bacterium]|nr:GNAT family N-acetyltransferase [Caldilineaceae bacterium]